MVLADYVHEQIGEGDELEDLYMHQTSAQAQGQTKGVENKIH